MNWNELAQDQVQWQTLVLVVFNKLATKCQLVHIL